MAKYLLHDIQAMLRGIKQVAQIGFKIQAEEINHRVCQSSLRPLAQQWKNNFASSSTKSAPFQVSFSLLLISKRRYSPS
nr:MAHS [Hypsibius exemplaris]